MQFVAKQRESTDALKMVVPQLVHCNSETVEQQCSKSVPWRTAPSCYAPSLINSLPIHKLLLSQLLTICDFQFLPKLVERKSCLVNNKACPDHIKSDNFPTDPLLEVPPDMKSTLRRL